ncbi:MAG: site-2 protease family protein [bacterium]
MSIIIFIIIITALIFVHELGHFLFAKLFKMRVDEFAIGFPPKIFSWKKGETTYSVNLVPFGGFVKIYGENNDEDSAELKIEERSFASKPRYAQAAVLFAGIVFNILFAWVLFTSSFYIGAPTAAGPGETGRLMISSVISASPAELSGLKPGDIVTEIDPPADAGRSGTGKVITSPTPDDIKNVVAGSKGNPILLQINRAGKNISLNIIPVKNIVGEKKDFAIGIEMVLVSVKKLSLVSSVIEGFQTTITSFKDTAVGIYSFLFKAFQAKADLGQVSGPVGIISIVGDASRFGFGYLLSFAAVISLNLAVINLIPFPALDGGRILIVCIEAIRRKAINAKVINWVNGLGFLILIIFMVAITYSDLSRIFGW